MWGVVWGIVCGVVWDVVWGIVWRVGELCGGSGGKLSVMPVGVADCTVKVGGVSLGVAPFFKKAAPKGSCEVVVSCPDGRKKKVMKRLGGGGDTRVIIKPGDW